MAFEPNVTSDFQKLVNVPDTKKQALINFSTHGFSELKDSLINYMKAVYPLDYQNFGESDLGIMLLELVAYMGSVMSVKADMLVHENFLSTAKNRNNVRKLLQLIGVNLRGPIGAAGNARLTLDTALDGSDQSVTISPAARVYTVTSPQDQAPVNYTLYKTLNGKLVDTRSDNSLLIDVSESDNSTSAVWTNLALLEGAFVIDTGSFVATQASKSISLNKAPVIDGSVEVFINGDSDTSGVWTQVDSLYAASGTSDKVFEVVYTNNNAATVVFGDNVVGKSPLIGDTFTVGYRVGGGSRGNIRSGVLNLTLTTDAYDMVGTRSGVLENISDLTGGQEAETVEHAKKYAPL